jgi:hypothetical protein
VEPDETRSGRGLRRVGSGEILHEPQLELTLRGDQGTWERQRVGEFSVAACYLNSFQDLETSI